MVQLAQPDEFNQSPTVPKASQALAQELDEQTELIKLARKLRNKRWGGGVKHNAPIQIEEK